MVHMLHVVAGALHPLRTVADQNSYGAEIRFRPEGPAQQSHRVYVWQPLTFRPFGVPPGHVLPMAAFTGQGFNPRASKMSYNGIPDAPVDPMATVVTPHATSLCRSSVKLSKIWTGSTSRSGARSQTFPGAQVDPRSILLQNRPVFQTPAFSSSLLSTLGRLRLLLLVVGHAFAASEQPATAKSRTQSTLLIGINPSKAPPDGYHGSAHGTWGQAANRARWHHCANGLLPLVASFQHASAHGHLRSSSPGQPPPPGNCC